MSRPGGGRRGAWPVGGRCAPAQNPGAKQQSELKWFHICRRVCRFDGVLNKEAGSVQGTVNPPIAQQRHPRARYAAPDAAKIAAVSTKYHYHARNERARHAAQPGVIMAG